MHNVFIFIFFKSCLEDCSMENNIRFPVLDVNRVRFWRGRFIRLTVGQKTCTRRHTAAQVFWYTSTRRTKKTTWCQSTHLRKFYLLSQWEGRQGAKELWQKIGASAELGVHIGKKKEERVLTTDLSFICYLPLPPNMNMTQFCLFYHCLSHLEIPFFVYTYFFWLLNLHIQTSFHFYL